MPVRTSICIICAYEKNGSYCNISGEKLTEPTSDEDRSNLKSPQDLCSYFVLLGGMEKHLPDRGFTNYNGPVSNEEL